MIYHKDYDHGVLYSMYFKHENRKQPGTMENSIVRLDEMLKEKYRTGESHFTSLLEMGKVKSFSGLERHEDIHFCEIFNVNAPKLFGGKQYQLERGVSMWTHAVAQDPLDEGYKSLIQKLLFDEGEPLEDADEV